MAKVEQKTNSAKKFIPTEVGIHNKAIDVLCMLQKCEAKISDYKKQIENVDADIELMHGYVFPDQRDIRVTLVHCHDWQVYVYRRILAYYLRLVTSLYKPAMYQHIYFYPQTQPAALTNGKAA